MIGSAWSSTRRSTRICHGSPAAAATTIAADWRPRTSPPSASAPSERDHQPLGEVAVGALERGGHRGRDGLAGHHVRLARVVRAGRVARLRDAVAARVDGDAAARVDDADLAHARERVGGEGRGERLLGGRAGLRAGRGPAGRARAPRRTASRPRRRPGAPRCRASRRRTSATGPPRRPRPWPGRTRRWSRCRAAGPKASSQRTWAGEDTAGDDARRPCPGTYPRYPARLRPRVRRRLARRAALRGHGPVAVRRSDACPGTGSSAPTAPSPAASASGRCSRPRAIPFRGERVDMRIARLPE